MSATELEAKRWTAIFDAVWMRRDDLVVTVIPQDKPGEAVVSLRPLGWMDSAEWNSLCGGERRSEIALHCTVAEWKEMIAQGVG